MRSAAFGIGNHNLRGKKSARLSCGCCDAFNFKDLCREKEADEEIRSFDLQDKDEDETIAG